MANATHVKTKIVDALISNVLWIIAAAFIASVSGVLDKIETKSSHNADIKEISSKLDRILDAMCRTDTVRVCATK